MVHKTKEKQSDLEKAVIESYKDMRDMGLDREDAKESVLGAVDGIIEDEATYEFVRDANKKGR
jgi:hypothetical protein